MELANAGSSDGIPDRVNTVVVGAGQAGLSAGYYLTRLGVSFSILDSHERVGDSWRKRWDSLRLFTPARYDGLPGMPFPGPGGHYPTKDEVADYLETYAQHMDLPIRLGVEVGSLRREGGHFEVLAGGQRLVADNVIVASGFDHQPRIPDFAADLDDDIVQLHSKDYRNPSQLRQGGVLVVGAGNSGAEISVEAASAGHETWLSGRDPGQEPTTSGSVADRLVTPLMWFAATRVIRVDRRIGRKVRDQFLHPRRGIPRGRVRRKDIDVAGVEWVPRTETARDGAPCLADGRVLEVSNIVWCTGFSPGFDWIDLPLSTKHGIPEHERGVVSAVPGLYFLGLYFQYSLSSPLVGGVGRDARYVVDHLASRRVAAEDDESVVR